MATCQKQRTGGWSTIFPNKQVTEQQSSLFVKKLLAIAVSNITYLRTIFPEHAFGDRCLEDLNLKILRDDSTCPGACQVIRWVRGCFDALEKKYLQAIVIGIYHNVDDPETVIESYTFKFSYGEGGGMDIYRNGSKLAEAYSEAETRKATIKLLRTIVILTQTLKPLPDDVMMTMKLLYYDDVTPVDYQPPNFVKGEHNFKHSEETVNIAAGEVATPFHMVKLRIQTAASQFELPTEQGQEERNEKTSHSKPATDPDEGQVVPMETVAKEPNRAAEVPPIIPPTSNHNNKPSPVVEASMDNSSQEVKVRCPCSISEDDGLMILCGVCNSWQHAVCFGLLEEEQVPTLHICEMCPQGDSQMRCTDPLLQYLAADALQTHCLLRRTLLVAMNADRVGPNDLMKRLGVEKSTAQGLLNRLEKEGLVGAAKGRRINRIVNKKKLVAALPKFMLAKDDQSEGGDKEHNPSSTTPPQNVPPAIIEGMDCLTAGVAKSLSLGSKHKSRVQEIQSEQVDEMGGVRRSPRLAKRARSLADQEAEFDLTYSQEEVSKEKKRKVSVADKSIMV